MNINNIINICFLLLILFETCQSLIQPSSRFRQSTVCVDNRIYFFGGASINNNRLGFTTTDQILYLDISKPFETNSPPFEEIPNVLNSFRQHGAAVGLYDTRKNIIYLFGGKSLNGLASELVPILHSYNLTTNEWDIPKTTGIGPKRVGLGIAGSNDIIDKNGKVYICGGQIFNEMNIFDTISLAWSKGSTSTLNTSLVYSTATLLSNGKIIFIGNISDTNHITTNMNQIPIYDTISNDWSLMITQGDSAENRLGHSAVLTPDGRIIIFGGTKDGKTLGSVINQLVVLDTNTNPYKWIAPKATKVIPTIVFHSATLVGKYMFVNFGLSSSAVDALFYILDIRNYTWVNKFEPEIPPETPHEIPPTSTSPADNGKKIGIIIGIAGGVFCTIIIIGFLVHKIYKSHKIRKYQHDIPHNFE